MLTQKFKAKLILMPKTDKEEQNIILEKNLTVGKKYRVFAIFDINENYTDFLIADNTRIYRWINASCFRAK